MPTTINNSLGKPNWSQRNNPDDPSTPWNETFETCNVTAAYTSGGIANWPMANFMKGLHPRGPMDLLLFMRQNTRCKALYEQTDPKHSSPMNEWMEIVAVGLDEYLGNPGVKLVYGASLTTIHSHICAGDGIVIHGNFTFKRADGSSVTGGHYESLVGLRADDNGTVTAWLVDDPYGDPITDYLSTMGNDIWLTMGQVATWIKPQGDGGKDANFIPKYK